MATTPVSFPQKVKIKLEIEFECSDQESLTYLSPNPVTAEPQVGVLADFYDVMGDLCQVPILSINGKTYADVKKEMEKQLP